MKKLFAVFAVTALLAVSACDHMHKDKDNDMNNSNEPKKMSMSGAAKADGSKCTSCQKQ